MNIKLIAGGLGVAVLGTSVAAVATQGFGLLKDAPWDPLSKDEGFFTASTTPKTVNTNYQGKFGDTYKSFLAGVKENNKEWWEWAFKRLKKDKPSTGKFKYSESDTSNNKVIQAYAENGDGDNAKALNQVCDAAYKKADSDFDESSSSEDKYKKSEVWKYCSPLGEPPKTLANETTRYTGKIGGGESNKGELVDDEGNDKFWTIRNNEFYGENGFEKISVDSEHTYFSTKQSSEEKTHIRDICKEAYGKNENSDSSSESSPKTDEVKKYCSFPKFQAS